MSFSLVTVNLDRKTGEKLSEDIEECSDVNESEIYDPLVEIFYKGFNNYLNNKEKNAS